MFLSLLLACRSASVIAPDAPPDTAAVDSGTTDSAVGDSGVDDTGGSPDTATPDTADPEAPPSPTGERRIAACEGTTGVDEACVLVVDATACTSAPCSRLVVVFSGGEMGCDSGRGYAGVLAGYAAHGYAAVCVNAFETAVGSGAAPFVDEARRIDIAMRAATTSAWARAYWTGEELLVQGISHGATAPVVLMARTELEGQAHWQGQSFTAGCFFDGSYDQPATADLLATGDAGQPCTEPVSHARWLERYCGEGATASTCDLRTNAKAIEDTVSGSPAARFAIRQFQMFECGSELPACSGDIIPSAPIETLCANLDASSSHVCSFTRLPRDGHLSCHARYFDDCRTWFERLPRGTR
jgi:hypothetical protein